MASRQKKTWDRLWSGVDKDTHDFCDKLARAKKISARDKSSSRNFLVGLAEQHLPTDLNADFNEPRMAAHVAAILKSAGFGSLNTLQDPYGASRQTYAVARGLRIYSFAVEAGLRSLPAPAIAARVARRWEVSATKARAALPPADQQALLDIEEDLIAGSIKQYQGFRSKLTVGDDGLKSKETSAYSSVRQYVAMVEGFLQYARRQGWQPFTLRDLLTPGHLTSFMYYAKRYDGGGLAADTIKHREREILAFFRHGRLMRPPVIVIDDALDAAIRTQMRVEHRHSSKWNWAAPELSNSGKTKWYPEIEEVLLAIKILEDEIEEATRLFQLRRLSTYTRWLRIRNAVLGLCTLFGMWRADTACTGSLLHLRKRSDGSVTDDDGFAIMEKVARAKNPDGTWYPFVPELIFTPNMLRYIRLLLELEGRTLEKPLRDGESAIVLSPPQDDGEPDLWGNDPMLLNRDLIVVPIFRKRPDRPGGLSYGQTKVILAEQLAKVRCFKETNPHTFRATGAIYWRFIQGMREHLVMKLGLWEDERTLRDCYAHLQTPDQLHEMAGYMPLGPDKPRKVRGRREAAASTAVRSLTKMLEKVTGPHEALRILKDVRRACEEIDQSIAADLGRRWEPVQPNPFEPGEELLIDMALRGKGYEGGISSVIGRPFTAGDRAAAIVENRSRGSGIARSTQRLYARTPTKAPLVLPSSRRRARVALPAPAAGPIPKEVV